MSFIAENMRSLLSALVKDPMLESLELSLKKPNIFNILKIEKREIRHSNFLAWLLDPQAGHNLSNTFLKWFLKDIFSDNKIIWINEFEVDNLDLENVAILREWQNIDLLIVAPKFVVSVENKLYAPLKPEQLRRYEKIIFREFKDKNKAFVLLTRYEISSEEENLPESYVLYSYEKIKENLERILEIYGDSLPLKVKFYIEDYLTTLRREVMKEDDRLIDIARKIYQNHKEALDFIFENRPDRLMEITQIADSVIKEMGFVSGTINKGYARFLTKALSGVIPKTGSGWKGKESFLFELDLWPKNITLKAVISPGDETVRSLLSNAMEKLKWTKKPSGKKWLVYFRKKRKIDLTEEKYEDEDVREKIKEVLRNNLEKIMEIEKAILTKKNELLKFVST